MMEVARMEGGAGRGVVHTPSPLYDWALSRGFVVKRGWDRPLVMSPTADAVAAVLAAYDEPVDGGDEDAACDEALRMAWTRD